MSTTREASAGAVVHPARLRDLIKSIPVVGPVAVGVYGRLLEISAPGLTFKQRIALLPLAGGLLVWANGIFRLNAVRQQIAQEHLLLRDMHAAQQALSTHLGHRIDQTNHRLDQFDRIDIASRLDRIARLDIGARLDCLERIDASPRLARFDILNISARLAALEQLTVLVEQIRVMQQQIGERDNRIAGLTQELRRYASERTGVSQLPDMARAAALVSVVPTPAAASTDMESFYVEFEDQFRGARDDISARLSIYLPYATKAAVNSGLGVIDVGCGRGEWLKLLANLDISATGIDMNQSMVDDCREQGLSAECEDAITYLQRQPAGSIAAVTGFHIIEHLPFDTLIALFDAALHALHPDGVVIFETPNPENLLVGSCNFYYDPTHLRPVVPAVAEFMAVQRGFARAEILRLHPYPSGMQVQEDTEIARRFNDAMYGAQDFAVVAWKTHAN